MNRSGSVLVCGRVLFWFGLSLRSTTTPLWLVSAVYFLPSAAQFGCFSLLVRPTLLRRLCATQLCALLWQLLFFAKLVNRHTWHAMKSFFITFCVCANLAVTVLTLLFAALLDRLSHLADPEPEETARATTLLVRTFYFCSACFLGSLSLLALYYVRRCGSVGLSPLLALGSLSRALSPSRWHLPDCSGAWFLVG